MLTFWYDIAYSAYGDVRRLVKIFESTNKFYVNDNLCPLVATGLYLVRHTTLPHTAKMKVCASDK